MPSLSRKALLRDIFAVIIGATAAASFLLPDLDPPFDQMTGRFDKACYAPGELVGLILDIKGRNDIPVRNVSRRLLGTNGVEYFPQPIGVEDQTAAPVGDNEVVFFFYLPEEIPEGAYHYVGSVEYIRNILPDEIVRVPPNMLVLKVSKDCNHQQE